MPTSDQSRTADVAALTKMIMALPRIPGDSAASRESSQHVGALLADAALQPGLNYASVVVPRVKRIATDYPEAATISGLRALLERCTAEEVLSNKNARKCAVFRNLVELMSSLHVDTRDELRDWLSLPANRPRLLAIKGVGNKTAAYLRLLVDLPAIAIDVHLRRAAADVGVTGSDEELEQLFTRAAETTERSLSEIDQSLWQAGAERSRRSAT